MLNQSRDDLFSIAVRASEWWIKKAQCEKTTYPNRIGRVRPGRRGAFYSTVSPIFTNSNTGLWWQRNNLPRWSNHMRTLILNGFMFMSWLSLPGCSFNFVGRRFTLMNVDWRVQDNFFESHRFVGKNLSILIVRSSPTYLLSNWNLVPLPFSKGKGGNLESFGMVVRPIGKDYWEYVKDPWKDERLQ